MVTAGVDALSGWAKGVEMHEAAPADAIGGVPARSVARPATTEEVSALLQAATSSGLVVVPRGAGTTLGWGAPPARLDVVLDTTALAGVVEHVAGDLVVAVRAGTRLVDLQAALAGSGQRLALDGDHGPATLGGLVAQGLSGPSRLGYGTLRDLLIGATFVLPDGVVAHAGGKVVKNVAGYDLCKLLHGSCGTLAVLTELVFRLHPLPGARRWLTVEAPSVEVAGRLVQAVLHSQLVPVALELDRPAGAAATLCALLEGREATVPSRAERLAGLLGPHAAGPPAISETPPAWWGRRPVGDSGPVANAPTPPRAAAPVGGTPRAADPAGATPPAAVTPAPLPAALLRLTTEVASLPALLAGVEGAAAATGLAVSLRGSAGVGSMLAAVAGPGGDLAPEAAALAGLVEQLRRGAAAWGGTVVALDGPEPSLGALDRWGPVAGLELMRRVKEQFDPDRLLSPGRFVGGI